MKNNKFLGGVELQLLTKQKTKSWSYSVPECSFTSSFGNPEEWYMEKKSSPPQLQASHPIYYFQNGR